MTTTMTPATLLGAVVAAALVGLVAASTHPHHASAAAAAAGAAATTGAGDAAATLRWFGIGDWGGTSKDAKHQLHVAEQMSTLGATYLPDMVINVGCVREGGQWGSGGQWAVGARARAC